MAAHQKILVTIAGATGVGKTYLSLSLADYFKTCIVSCDSRQFYREIPIGTAAPTQEELRKIPHYFIHHKSVREAYNVGDFEKDAAVLLGDLFKKYAVVVMVGGSGLYMDAVVEGLHYFPTIDFRIREQLERDVAEKGLFFLQEKLKILDRDSYEQIDLKNPRRVLRALEICIGTGKKFSDFKNAAKPKRNFYPLNIGLNPPRAVIYERIEKRVDAMLKKGLLQEAKKVYLFKNYNALQTVGYKELFAYFEKKISLEQAVEEIKKNTRRFAKRQLTWFLKKDSICWFDHNATHAEIQAFLEQEIQKMHR